MQVSSLPRSSLALPASRFPRMSLTPTHHHHPSASTRIPARVFPYNLKFLHPTRHLTPPALSIRARFDSASNRASSKSLMEDDAELSDWVSELRMTPAFTDGRDGPEGRPKKRGRDASLPSINSNGFRDRDMNMNTVGSKGSNFEHRSRGRGRGANHLIRGSGSRSFQSEFEQDGDKLGMHTRGGTVRGGVRGRRNFGSRGGGRVMGNTDKQKGGVASSRIEKTVSGFMDLIGEQTSDVDGETQEIEVTNRTSLFRREDNEESISRSPEGTGSYLTETSFDQFDVSHSSLRAIKDAGYVKMTVVQEATLPFILKGKDVMAKAKTGTGKTVAFMLPSIEVVVKSSSSDPNTRRPPILVLVICPTRELANQAAAEANTLLKYHPSIGVQVVIGGTNLSAEQKHMKANPCQILVATPGRLKDHIENTTGFATRLMGLKVLVLDEADHLLDMGFRKDIEKIISSVPKQRQTLLFSATVPEEVQQVSHIALKRDHEFINTVQEGAEDTHSQVRQMHLVAPMENHFPLLYIILKEHISDDVNYKVIVFCTTAMVTKLVAETLGELNLNVREIHSRKTQSYRTRVSDEFRKSKGLILVTSDVSARGVDYPDVSLVIQLGVPADREQYIHRLGRTGRKGKEGHGILLLAPWEQFFLSSIKDLPITKAPSPTVDPDAKRKVERALSNVEMKSKELAYQAWLGYYNSNKNVGKDKARLVELGNEFSRCMGLNEPPAIPKVVIGKMGLKNVPGLRSK